MFRISRLATVWALNLGVGVSFTVVGLTAEKGGPRFMTLVNETCASCHGTDGNSVVPEFPKLAGQQKSDLLREMQDYKEGRRQHEIMSTLMAGLSEGEMEALADYYAAQPPAPGEVDKPELLSLGKRIYLEGNTQSGVPSCDGCHEENGKGSKKFPRVAGQHQPTAWSRSTNTPPASEVTASRSCAPSPSV